VRLDFFRGIGLWMIFLDHIPHDVVSWLTLRNYGFSDAAEFFVFISGYLVGFIYTPIVRGGLFLAALKRLWKRAAQLYIAQSCCFCSSPRRSRGLRDGSTTRCMKTNSTSSTFFSIRRADRTGDHAAIQARQSRRAAALHRPGARSAVHDIRAANMHGVFLWKANFPLNGKTDKTSGQAHVKEFFFDWVASKIWCSGPVN
jgi:hypothetical protein